MAYTVSRDDKFLPTLFSKNGTNSGTTQRSIAWKIKEKAPIGWNQTTEECFIKLKDSLKQAALLAYAKPDAPLILVADASATSIGVAFQQKVGENWKPSGFFQKNEVKLRSNTALLTENLWLFLIAVQFLQIIC